MISLKLERFALAVDRDRRSEVPSDWIEQLSHIPGVEIIGQPSSRSRVLIAASDGGIVGIRNTFKNAIRIERLVDHQLAS
jgi:hypothetical protein